LVKNILTWRQFGYGKQPFGRRSDERNQRLSSRKMKFVRSEFEQAWIEIHKEELLANWDLCISGK